MTAGVDLGDKYSYLFVLDNDSGEVVEGGKLRTTPDDGDRRFDSAEPMKIAIEVGTHSTWVSRLLQECAHEVLIANPRKTRPDRHLVPPKVPTPTNASAGKTR